MRLTSQATATEPLSIATLSWGAAGPSGLKESSALHAALAQLEDWEVTLTPFESAEALLQTLESSSVDLLLLEHRGGGVRADDEPKGGSADASAAGAGDEASAATGPEPGLEVLRKLRAAGHGGAALMVIESREPELVRAVLASGADGCLTVDDVEPLLLDSMIRVALAQTSRRA